VTLVKKRGPLLSEWPSEQERRGVKGNLSRLFIYIAGKLFIGFTLLDEFALSPADLNMNFRAPFSFVTDEITH
jgi:hypothetical protein